MDKEQIKEIEKLLNGIYIRDKYCYTQLKEFRPSN
jgi:hypothetical protein